VDVVGDGLDQALLDFDAVGLEGGVGLGPRGVLDGLVVQLLVRYRWSGTG